ncbi:PREDICTED: erythroid differentiation-related factor 1-like [Priapulus caudatus]|uniref:Erythroid differentiation-related factor 1-like n=1 Tax=Priapulus caudatus TaxID=37621 RepID=A0ABM1F613_PRICU|nr:PREDICTED: erythroid differentiation-related factor 1-like [Priapulus caudatus]
MSGDESNDDGNTDKENHNTAVCLASESETENEENEELFAQNLGASAGDVKSKAVVKYSSVRTPAKFCELQSNTDLNNPPSNWLRRQGAKFGVKGTWTIRNGPTEFSSLSIANTFPDSIGQVDVISDAENIKKLLKMPYNDSHMSMMVHRVHRTLLLDDFDIHRHLLRTSETEWKWLRRFFYEQHIGIDRPDNSRGSLQNRSMFSKFLYHSLADANVDDSLSPEPRHRSNSLPDRYHSVLSPETHCHPQAHISRTRESSNKDSKKSEFLRNVLWTFEDINMLIGTDMPIFGGGTRPAVSLRLRDMGKPINVLTGMDYWLDNLMCNVPELAMCYHIDGIVQYYELMKTEDIPNLKESKFSPIVVKDIAQNILSFLKSNAAKEGHTYWLFKGSNDDIVKLYDLTTLCGADTDAQRREGQRAEEEEEEQVEEENPFTVPVAMLLYRVARNMAAAPDGRSHTSDICKLLRNCIRLLQSDGRHADKSEIIASANYMLSDFLLPAEGYLNNKQKESGTGSAGEEPSIVVYKDISDEDSNYHLRQADISVTVKALCMPDQPTFADQESERPQYMYESLEDRCLAALKYIAQGLTYVEKSSWSRQDTVNPHFPIPLPYESLASPRTNSPVPESSLESRVATSDPIQERVAVRSPLSDGPPPNSWQYQLKVLLLHKATVAWHTLAESASSLNKFGRALKYIKLALTCLEVARALCSAIVLMSVC